jgi:hypothetical protein
VDILSALSLVYNTEMSRKWICIISGAVLTLLPFLGFPASWERIALTVLGLVVFGVGVSVPSNPKKKRRAQGKTGRAKKVEVTSEAPVEVESLLPQKGPMPTEYYEAEAYEAPSSRKRQKERVIR